MEELSFFYYVLCFFVQEWTHTTAHCSREWPRRSVLLSSRTARRHWDQRPGNEINIISHYCSVDKLCYVVILDIHPCIMRHWLDAQLSQSILSKQERMWRRSTKWVLGCGVGEVNVWIQQDGNTPLHLAADSEVAALLIAEKADVEETNKASWGVLKNKYMHFATPHVRRCVACHHFFFQTERKDSGANCRCEWACTTCFTPYLAEVKPHEYSKSQRCCKTLLLQWFDDSCYLLLNHTNSSHNTKQNGYTALHCAALNGHTELVELLVAEGADKEAKEKVIY